MQGQILSRNHLSLHPNCFYPKMEGTSGIFAKNQPYFDKNMAKRLVGKIFISTFAPLSDSSAVGSALRSGRRGRAFESPHSDSKSDD